MRIPKAVIGLYGGTCVGKSTLARELGNNLPFRVRHCSHALKALAPGMSVADIPVEVHEKVDAETRSLAKGNDDGLIVEGRFLDRVLSSTSNLVLVRLVCDKAVRTARLHTRDDASASVDENDANDAALIAKLYENVGLRVPDFIVDTSSLGAVDAARSVLDFLNSF